MRRSDKSIFAALGKVDAICITTNCIVKADGTAVMGKGNALEARNRFPGIDKTLGNRIKAGNPCSIIAADSFTQIISFPTKHDWRNPSDLGLIEKSAAKIRKIADFYKWTNIAFPPPGCGNGGLKWSMVYPILDKYFDNRFIVCFGRS